MSPALLIRRFATTLVWAAVGFATVAWGLHLYGHHHAAHSAALPPAAWGSPVLNTSGEQLKRALGAAPQPVGATPLVPSAPAPMPSQSSRFSVRGIAYSGSLSSALIAIDGQAPKPYVIGAEVIGDWRIAGIEPKAVRLRSATLGEAKVELLPVRP